MAQPKKAYLWDSCSAPKITQNKPHSPLLTPCTLATLDLGNLWQPTSEVANGLKGLNSRLEKELAILTVVLVPASFFGHHHLTCIPNKKIHAYISAVFTHEDGRCLSVGTGAASSISRKRKRGTGAKPALRAKRRAAQHRTGCQHQHNLPCQLLMRAELWRCAHFTVRHRSSA